MAPADSPVEQAPVPSRVQVVIWPALMLFIIAYVEAVCFLGLFQTLTGYISGATILLAAEFFRDDGNFRSKILVLVTFVPGTFFWLMLKEHLSGWRYFVTMLFTLEAVLLMIFMGLAIHLSPLVSANATATMLIVAISVFAMALHNVHSLQVMPEKAKIAITALFISFASSTVHLCALLRTSQPTAEAAASFRALLYPLLAFFVGAFLGAFAYMSFGFAALASPIAILLALAINSVCGSTRG